MEPPAAPALGFLSSLLVFAAIWVIGVMVVNGWGGWSALADAYRQRKAFQGRRWWLQSAAAAGGAWPGPPAATL